MNYAKDETQAVAATSQNAMHAIAQIDEASDCAKSHDSRLWTMADYRAFMAYGLWSKADCRNAALVTGQLRYWTPKATVTKNGYKWIKKSVTDWENELGGLSRREVERVNEILVHAQYAHIEQFEWGRRRSPSNHYRLTEKALAAQPVGKHVQSVRAKGKPLVQTVQVTESTKPLSENTYQVQKQSPVPDETPASPESTQEQAGEIQTPKPTPAILDEYTGHEALKTSPDYWRYELWVSLLEKHGHPVPSYVKPKRMREYLSMLQRLDYRVTGHGEDTFADMLDCLLGGWDAWRCAFSGHGYDAPVTPTIAFLTKYAMRAYGWDTDDEATEQPEQVANQPTTPLADTAECVAVPEVVEPVTEPVVVKETPAPCADQCDGGYTWQDVLDGWAAEAARVAKKVAPTPQPNMFQHHKVAA